MFVEELMLDENHEGTSKVGNRGSLYMTEASLRPGRFIRLFHQ